MKQLEAFAKVHKGSLRIFLQYNKYDQRLAYATGLSNLPLSTFAKVESITNNITQYITTLPQLSHNSRRTFAKVHKGVLDKSPLQKK